MCASALVAPPGLDAGTTDLLRRAFDPIVVDPQFLAEAKAMHADIAPTSGEDVQKLVADIYATPRPIVERAKKILCPLNQARGAL